jgi:thiol-disulfide isomerase/thioredoxin
VDRVQAWAGAVVAAVVLVAASLLGVLWRRRNGRFVPAATSAARTTSPDTAVLTRLGVTSGTPVTLLQFSSAFCAPCRATRVLCADIAGRVPGVRHVDVDAEAHLDAVRALGIWRTPTVLLVDDTLTVRRRASGAPTRAQLLAAVADVLPPTPAAEADTRVA